MARNDIRLPNNLIVSLLGNRHGIPAGELAMIKSFDHYNITFDCNQYNCKFS